MLSFNHPNVMPLVGMALDGEKPLLIMPFMMQGTLLQYVRKNKSYLFETKTSSNFEKVGKGYLPCAVFILLPPSLPLSLPLSLSLSLSLSPSCVCVCLD